MTSGFRWGGMRERAFWLGTGALLLLAFVFSLGGGNPLIPILIGAAGVGITSLVDTRWGSKGSTVLSALFFMAFAMATVVLGTQRRLTFTVDEPTTATVLVAIACLSQVSWGWPARRAPLPVT